MKFTSDEVLNTSPPAAEPVPAPKKARGRAPRAPKPDEDEAAREEGPYEDEGDGRKPSALSKLKSAFFLLLILIGFGLFAVNAKGLIDSMRIDDASHPPTVQTTDEDGGGDEAPGEDAGTDAPEGGETDGADAPQETPEAEGGDAAGADGSNDAQGDGTDAAISGADADRLRKEAQDAKDAAATMEQELNNAKALLDASTAREAQLKSELDAKSGGGK